MLDFCHIAIRDMLEYLFYDPGTESVYFRCDVPELTPEQVAAATTYVGDFNPLVPSTYFFPAQACTRFVSNGQLYSRRLLRHRLPRVLSHMCWLREESSQGKKRCGDSSNVGRVVSGINVCIYIISAVCLLTIFFSSDRQRATVTESSNYGDVGFKLSADDDDSD